MRRLTRVMGLTVCNRSIAVGLLSDGSMGPLRSATQEIQSHRHGKAKNQRQKNEKRSSRFISVTGRKKQAQNHIQHFSLRISAFSKTCASCIDGAYVERPQSVANRPIGRSGNYPRSVAPSFAAAATTLSAIAFSSASAKLFSTGCSSTSTARLT